MAALDTLLNFNFPEAGEVHSLSTACESDNGKKGKFYVLFMV